MWNNGMFPNIYGSQGIDEAYNQYKQMQQMFQQTNANPSMGQRGTFVEIHNYSEVENYPVPTNGVPVLFFDFANYVFYSKKFVNGQCSIQDFYFSPMNGKNKGKEEPMEQDPAMSALFERMDELEKKLSELQGDK